MNPQMRSSESHGGDVPRHRFLSFLKPALTLTKRVQQQEEQRCFVKGFLYDFPGDLLYLSGDLVGGNRDSVGHRLRVVRAFWDTSRL